MPLDAQTRFIKYLEKAGKLNRAIEFLPSDEELAARKAAKIGLTSPERAVLLAYSKIMLYDELLASKVPDDPYISTALVRYFPAPLRERYREQMERHPLKREIIATHVTNEMINRVGQHLCPPHAGGNRRQDSGRGAGLSAHARDIRLCILLAGGRSPRQQSAGCGAVRHAD